jgi:uncharacterized protein YerC
MSHVSKVKLRPQISLKIKANLVKALKTADGRIIESLLTPVESVMLSKRLAMIIMLDKGCTSYEIQKVLGVSTSTIQRFQRMLATGVFAEVRRILKGKSRVTTLELMQLLFFPHGNAAHRKKLADIRKRIWE